MLIGTMTAGLPGIASPAYAEPVAVHPDAPPYADDVAEAAQRFGIPGAWIDAVIRVESDGDRRSVSSKGAMGLMQLMPENWTEMRARLNLGGDPFDPHDNILAGTALLRELHDRYGAPGFLAAYNAGPGRYEDYRDRHRKLPAETVVYVAKLAPMITGNVSEIRIGMASAVAADPLPWAFAPLFVMHSARPDGDDLAAPKPPSDSTPGAIKVSDLSAMTPQSEGLFVALPARNTAP
jgi:soluble lytic murein transglycosylase-like protein